MKKLVTYLVTLGMMFTMMPTPVSADDTAAATAVTEESAEKNTDRETAAVEAMKNMNTIFSLTDGSDSKLEDYSKVDDERFTTVESVKKFIADTCTGSLKDEFIEKCEKSLIEKEDGLYKRNSGRFFFTFLTDGGVEITEPAMDAFTAVTKKKDDMNDYGKAVFKADGNTWKISSYSFKSSNDEADNNAEFKELAGNWIYEVADGGYTVDICSKYNGRVTVNEDGTFTFKNAEGSLFNGKITTSAETYSDGSSIPYLLFSTGDTNADFGGYRIEGSDIINLGNGGMAHLVRDKNYDQELNDLTVQRIENYLLIEKITSGGLESDMEVFFKKDNIPYYKVTNKEYTSIADIKKFINENTAGAMNKTLLEYCDERFIEKDGILYESYAGKGSVGTNTSCGVIITDKTDKSFNATTIALNGIGASGHTRAVFTADGDTWKLSGIDYDTYTFNKSIEDHKLCAESRVASMIYCMRYLEKGADTDAKEKIKIDGVEYAKDADQMYTIDELKSLVANACTDQPRKMLFANIEKRLVEKDGTVYRIADEGQVSPDFNLNDGMKILSITDKGFKAATEGFSQRDGYGIFEFVKEGDRFVLSSYSYSAFNEERLFGGYVDTQSGGLNLREKPDIKSTIIDEIPQGTQINIYKCDTDGWYKTEFKGNVGYVNAEFIKNIPDGDIPDTTTATSAVTTTTTTATTTSATTTTTTAATTSATTTSAKNNNIKAGDVTKDDVIDGRDATAILTHYAKTSTGQKGDLSEEQIEAAEVNKDGIVDGKDATIVLSYYAYTSSGNSITLDEYIKK